MPAKLTSYTVRARGGVLHESTQYTQGSEIKLAADDAATLTLLKQGKITAQAIAKTTEVKN